MSDRPTTTLTGLRAQPIPDTLDGVILYAVGAQIELTFRPSTIPPGMVVEALAYVSLPDTDGGTGLIDKISNRQIIHDLHDRYLRLFVARLIIDLEDEIDRHGGAIVEEPSP